MSYYRLSQDWRNNDLFEMVTVNDAAAGLWIAVLKNHMVQFFLCSPSSIGKMGVTRVRVYNHEWRNIISYKHGYDIYIYIHIHTRTLWHGMVLKMLMKMKLILLYFLWSDMKSQDLSFWESERRAVGEGTSQEFGLDIQLFGQINSMCVFHVFPFTSLSWLP